MYTSAGKRVYLSKQGRERIEISKTNRATLSAVYFLVITNITKMIPKIAIKASTPPAASILPKLLGWGVGIGVGEGAISGPGVGGGPSKLSYLPTLPCIITGPEGFLALPSPSFVTYKLENAVFVVKMTFPKPKVPSLKWLPPLVGTAHTT